VHSQKLLVSGVPHNSNPADDYDLRWHLLAHPSVFPYGTGARPANMTFETWCRILLCRWPLSQFSENFGLCCDMFNQWQRHAGEDSAQYAPPWQRLLSLHPLPCCPCSTFPVPPWPLCRAVNLHSRLVLRASPHLVHDLASVTQQEMSAVLSAMTSPGHAATLSPKCRMLLNAVHRVGHNVIGSPRAFLSLRSQAASAVHVFGPWTMALNISPFEICAPWVFRLAGEPYEFDSTGRPATFPDKHQRKKIVARSSFACAHFANLYFKAVRAILLGWPDGSAEQVNPRCLFGEIYALLFKYEDSFRAGQHAHALTRQPALSVENIRRLCANGVMHAQLLAFSESVMCCYEPELTNLVLDDGTAAAVSLRLRGRADVPATVNR
jgi:hypothetical protein